MILYMAGQMTDIPDLNWPAFDQAAAEWRADGHTVINPAEMDREMGIDSTVWETLDERGRNSLMRKVFAADFTALCQCDGIVLLPGWEKSRGARVELSIAQLLRMQVFDAHNGNRMRHLEHTEVLYEPCLSNT